MPAWRRGYHPQHRAALVTSIELRMSHATGPTHGRPGPSDWNAQPRAALLRSAPGRGDGIPLARHGPGHGPAARVRPVLLPPRGTARPIVGPEQGRAAGGL